MPHQKLIRVLNYVWLLVVFPVVVAIFVGVLGHSVNLGIKTFLLIECGMAVLSPLLSAIISDGNHTHHHRRKEFFSGEIRVGSAICLRCSRRISAETSVKGLLASFRNQQWMSLPR